MEDENGAGERNLVRLTAKYNASLYPADLRIWLNVVVVPTEVSVRQRSSMTVVAPRKEWTKSAC
jgi:hypothetical protein